MNEAADRIKTAAGHPLLRSVVDAAEGPVYLVGGSVRDLFLHRPVHDYDVVVPLNCRETALAAARFLGVHAAPMGRPPLSTWRLALKDVFLDVCPMFGPDMEADLLRRDLTVNAMALELTGDADAGKMNLLDPAGGRRDLEDRRCRFVSEANVLDDPLRILRLFRLAAQLGFTIYPDSLELARKHAALVTDAAGERIREELMALLSVPGDGGVFAALLESGVLYHVFPELRPLAGCRQGGHHHLDVLDHSLAVLDHGWNYLEDPESVLPEYAGEIRQWASRGRNRALLRLTLLLHDIGKPETRTIVDEDTAAFHGHDEAGARLVADIAARLRFSSAESEFLQHMIRLHLRLFHLMDAGSGETLSRRAVWRYGRAAGSDLWGLVTLALADITATQGPLQREKGGLAAFVEFLKDFLPRLAEQNERAAQAPPLVDGRDLMAALGLSPSPLLGRLLAAVEESRAIGEIATREEALTLARRMLKEGEGGNES